MEKLRDIWENRENQVEEKMKANLYTRDGEVKPGIELNIDKEKINSIIEGKISNGIKNFFIGMREAFKNEDVNKINILLDGNSCKHPFVTKKFKEYILGSEKI